MACAFVRFFLQNGFNADPGSTQYPRHISKHTRSIYRLHTQIIGSHNFFHRKYGHI